MNTTSPPLLIGPPRGGIFAGALMLMSAVLRAFCFGPPGDVPDGFIDEGEATGSLYGPGD